MSAADRLNNDRSSLDDPPTLREALSAFELEEFQALAALENRRVDSSFDFHDTIPAPPWLDDAPDTVEAPLVPSR